jgi:hypothetical protein
MPRITRTWVHQRSTCWVSTNHPTLGPLQRGHITRHDGAWHVVDQDHQQVATVVGDYIDAEQALLDATTWADET